MSQPTWPIRHSTLSFFFFNDTATTEIYTLSLHDALPISSPPSSSRAFPYRSCARVPPNLRNQSYGVPIRGSALRDRKSTRLNSSHGYISYAVFCLKKKNIQTHSLLTLTYHLIEYRAVADV